jgi:hypothetical protein
MTLTLRVLVFSMLGEQEITLLPLKAFIDTSTTPLKRGTRATTSMLYFTWLFSRQTLAVLVKQLLP